ncbi:PEP-CTERM sorting domain-containing protein [Nitrosospira sp. NpAV]|uniref:PEP-CTERM sorting domain-containing protein n=1 Tax=Nitrosospira sp. NpAV TaxID=58133 RepID=UPI0005A040E6|nr:PEP-CTERM sorting domain-containing protein [Nitrosospira sp. NpAV]KIO49416.1 hypothetical protein SQ11_06965 [Nitrosospira sp. NpAV]
MRIMNLSVSWGALLASLSLMSAAQASSINVLWYTYADPASEYRQKFSQLASVVHTLPQSDGSTWNLTYWDANSAAPDFSAYNVLVVESGESFRTGATPNGPLAIPDYGGILDNKVAIEAARGDRTFITAADSDFHALRGDTGNIPDDPSAPDGGGKCAPALTAPSCWDGAVGHSVNAINWAGSGNGLGIVSFLDGEHPGSFWWTNANSFLRDELAGHVNYAGADQSPVINPLQAGYAFNSGLTSQGLSDWDNSFHATFLPIDGYTQIVDSSLRPGSAVAIATSVVPESETYAMMLAGLTLIGAITRRRKNPVA